MLALPWSPAGLFSPIAVTCANASSLELGEPRPAGEPRKHWQGMAVISRSALTITVLVEHAAAALLGVMSPRPNDARPRDGSQSGLCVCGAVWELNGCKCDFSVNVV